MKFEPKRGRCGVERSSLRGRSAKGSSASAKGRVAGKVERARWGNLASGAINDASRRTESCQAGKFWWGTVAVKVGDPAHRALA